MSKPLLLLIDGSSYLFRAFHALPPLSTQDGKPTGALHGVLAMIQKLMQEEQPSHVAVVFDAPGKTFRDELYPAYKAHRPPMPEELMVQIEPLHQAIRAMGLPLLIVDGVEADDVIATLSREAQARGLPVLISTGDKDLAQLVAPGVMLVDTMKNTRLDPAGVVEKFGVPPERMVDYLALVGDASDNVPGVQGCGPKTAVKWLQAYGSLEGVMAHAGEIKGKAGEGLRAALDKLPLWRELVTVRADVPLPVGLDDLRPGPPDLKALIELAERYELHRHLKAWREQLDAPAGTARPARDADDPQGTSASTQPPPHGRGAYTAILDEQAFQDCMQRLQGAELIAFDTETTCLDPMQAELVGLSFAMQEGEAVYIPLAHNYPDAPRQLDRTQVLERLRPLLEGKGHAKVGQNLKYDAHVLANHGIALAGIVHDTMLESYVLDAGQRRHDLDGLARRYLHYETMSYEQVVGKGAKQKSFAEVELPLATQYAAEDADICLRLHHRLWPRLLADAALKGVYEDIEMPLVPVLLRMERTGVCIDAALLAKVGAELGMRMQALEQQAHALAGEAFNLASPKQLQAILFERLGLPVVKRTPGGQPSTDEDVLEQLAELHELPRVILEHRTLAKLKSGYTDTLPQAINPRTGRVHTMYQQAVASTGRLSSTEPNLQNIPVRTPEGQRIRQAFIAPPGELLLSADYSQIELRIMAHLSGDEGLRKAFAEGLDIHRATAAEVFGVPLEQVSDLQRRAAKAINFGLIYGMSAFGLARQLTIPRAEAQAYIDLYFARYPGVRRYMEEAREKARAKGYVETLFGRRLMLPEIRSRDARRRQQAERIAINAPMQGTAADIIKRAMIDIDAWLREGGLAARMIMQVHDELVFEVEEAQLEALAEGVKARMAGAASLSVPLVVDIGWGRNWDEAH